MVVRGRRVLLESQAATLYGVEVAAVRAAVARNVERFPADFVFELTAEEAEGLLLPPSPAGPPYAFTDPGVAMLSGLLASARAAQANVEAIRSLMRVLEVLATQAEGVRDYARLERRYDTQFGVTRKTD